MPTMSRAAAQTHGERQHLATLWAGHCPLLPGAADTGPPAPVPAGLAPAGMTQQEPIFSATHGRR